MENKYEQIVYLNFFPLRCSITSVSKQSPANKNIGCKTKPWNMEMSAILPCIKVAKTVIIAMMNKIEVINLCFMGNSCSMNMHIE